MFVMEDSARPLDGLATELGPGLARLGDGLLLDPSERMKAHDGAK